MPNISNSDAFQIEAAAILASGYDHFPSKFGWKYDADDDNYPTELGSSREQIQFDTILWLRDHDYISGGGFCGGEWQGMRLTERALVALRSVPDVLDGKEPLGKRLSKAVASSAGIEAIKAIVTVAIAKHFGGV